MENATEEHSKTLQEKEEKLTSLTAKYTEAQQVSYKNTTPHCLNCRVWFLEV